MKCKRGTILVLSSEPVVRSVMKEILEREGYVVLATGELGTAVDMMSDCSFDLLITHPYVDCITGQKAATYLRARNPQMKVLMVAGLVADDRIKIPAELEDFEIFPRPFTATEFVREVDDFLNKARERARQNLAVWHG